MNHLHRLAAVAILAAFFIAPSNAQNAGTVTNHAFAVGKGPGVQGFESLLCGSAQLPVGQSGASPLCKTITGALSLNASGVASLPGGGALIASRAAAAALDLSAFSVVETMGYASAGDGGGATFKKNGTSPYIDSGIASGSVTTGGTCSTNGTFYGVSPTGGSGQRVQGIVVIAGGVMTSFTPTGAKGNAYAVGDVLTIPNGSYAGSTLTCSVSPTWTVATVSTPLASFADTAGNHWQYVVDAGNLPNVRQFGAKLDRAGKANDGLATNDQPSIQAALNFAGYGVGSGDAGGFVGNTVRVPAGTALVCGGLVVPLGVILAGVSNPGTTLKECDTEASTQQFITLGDPNNHQTASFTGIRDMTLFGANAAISGTVAMVYSNSVQGDAIWNVSIYPIYRGCVYTETGWGGVAIFHIHLMYCVPNSAVTPFGVSLSGSAKNVIDGGSWFSSGGAWSGIAINVTSNGPLLNEFFDVHCEMVATCAYVNVPAGGSGTMTHIRGMSGGPSVVNVINRVTGSVTGQLKVETSGANGAACTVMNGAACASTGNIISDTVY